MKTAKLISTRLSQRSPMLRRWHLFAENLGFADFNTDMRNALLGCAHFDWSRISPAIFGSLFQEVTKERRQIGAHYTSERDILKVIRSLFLDELPCGVQPREGQQSRSQTVHGRLSELCFLY